MIVPEWILPIGDPPIAEGRLVIENGIIRFVGRELPSRFQSLSVKRLPGIGILPGLINTHCHLEFSDLVEPIPSGASFPDWVRGVLARRQSLAVSAEETIEMRKNAVVRGILESFASGVRWVVDMTTQPWDSGWLALAFDQIAHPSQRLAEPIVVQPCIELIDITPTRNAQTQALLEKQLSAPEMLGIGRIGLSPHAPYTASVELTRLAAMRSRDEQRLVCMHLAESSDEMRWLESHDGPFQPWLSPLVGPEYLSLLGSIENRVTALFQAWRGIIAHGNYLSPIELQCMQRCRDVLSISHCPRTHAHFDHQHLESSGYPMKQRIEQGVRHLLGTDSRASNPDLNLWKEAQSVRAFHPGVDSLTILKMLTTDAADFLQITDRVGTLREGVPANLTAVLLEPDSIRSRSAPHIYDAILSSNSVSQPLEALL